MTRPIDEFMHEVGRRLGWRKLFADRALREIRDHLEDAAAAAPDDAIEERDAQLCAVTQFGSVEATVAMIIDLNRGLRIMDRIGDRATLAMLFLLAPPVALMGVSVLTYNADLALLRGLAGPLHLLDWKFMWLRVLLTIALPLLAASLVIGRSVRVQRADVDGDSRLGIFVVAPSRFFYRLGVVALVMIAVFIYY